MTAETIEGTATVVRDEPDEPRGLQVVSEVRGHLVSGLGAVMALTDEQFETNLAMLSKAKDRAQKLQRALLTEGTDYGTVPGIPRPFLHKPGAEIFEKAYGLATSYEVERKVGDGVKTPELEYIVHAKVHLGDTDGPVVGEGLGSCNTHETKYRYRSAKRSCPECQVEGLVKGKADGRLKGKWWCPPNNGGCGKTFAPEDQRITDQVVGQVENENPYDLANTILKMARKRAGVDGILTTTGTSGLFTQDDDSPAVRADAGGVPVAGGAQESTTERPVELPKIPAGIKADTSLGEVTLAGRMYATESGPADGLTRQSPDGAIVGFRLELAGGVKIPQVIARGQLAEALGTITGGNPNKLAGDATVTGELIAVPWTKKNDDGDVEDMPPFRRLEVSRIQTADWTLPAPDEAPKAKGKTKPAPQTGAVSTGPGMTSDAFVAACKAGRVALTYALAQAKSKWPEIEALHALSDAQRLELAGDLGVLSQEEE